MIKPRTLTEKDEVRRPTVQIAPGESFAGWGPRLRY
jgi:hypothetical protein